MNKRWQQEEKEKLRTRKNGSCTLYCWLWLRKEASSCEAVSSVEWIQCILSSLQEFFCQTGFVVVVDFHLWLKNKEVLLHSVQLILSFVVFSLPDSKLAFSRQNSGSRGGGGDAAHNSAGIIFSPSIKILTILTRIHRWEWEGRGKNLRSTWHSLGGMSA